MQGGYLSLLSSTGDKPLEYWSKQKSRTGSIQRVLDKELNERVLEIQDVEDANCQKTWIMCPPATDQILDVKLPVLVIILKSLQSHLLIQLQVADKDDIRHLINLTNVEASKKKTEAKTVISPLKMHLALEPGWNKLELDLGQLCKVFGARFGAVTRLKICANCRIRRLHFLDRHYEDDEVSVALYQGFLDHYMSKWGIRAIERATQTKKTLGKPGKDAIAPTVNTLTKLFLKSIQSKSDRAIDQHMSRNPLVTPKDYVEFKRKAKIKPYAIPDKSKLKGKKSSESNWDLSQIRDSFKQYESLNLYEKSAVKEKPEKKPDTAVPATFVEKQEIKNLMYKVYRYRYPVLTDTKPSEAKKEVPTTKYSVVKK
ncbi:uncharacterized protein LOC106637498 [Copidosoma floridanum]|uniref:uncharacterized protein LOC106637498 n=1 Tax=Copidosoma floridanum TaxID=29053 RepID=UPI0006C9CCF6|nr:uncharacterized protein LOC106637498 [Copidosoma floridanum]